MARFDQFIKNSIFVSVLKNRYKSFRKVLRRVVKNFVRKTCTNKRRDKIDRPFRRNQMESVEIECVRFRRISVGAPSSSPCRRLRWHFRESTVQFLSILDPRTSILFSAPGSTGDVKLDGEAFSFSSSTDIPSVPAGTFTAGWCPAS